MTKQTEREQQATAERLPKNENPLPVFTSVPVRESANPVVNLRGTATAEGFEFMCIEIVALQEASDQAEAEFTNLETQYREAEQRRNELKQALMQAREDAHQLSLGLGPVVIPVLEKYNLKDLSWR